jgi:hypothetical protein
MDLTDAAVGDFLEGLVADQQLRFGGRLNALVRALRNQRAPQRRAALVCLVAVAVAARPDAPVTRWLPGVPEPERHHVFFRAVHDEAMRFLADEASLAEFLRAMELFWRLT